MNLIRPLELPGDVRQIGHVVVDLDAEIQGWVAVGVGPWFVIREMTRHVDYRGKPCEVVLSIAVAHSGEMQFELIQQHGDTPSIFTEFLATRGPGFHQLAWWVEDVAATAQLADDAGYPVVWGELDGAVPYCYLEPPAGPVAVIEISELNELTEGMATMVRQASENWDGTDPVRSLMG